MYKKIIFLSIVFSFLFSFSAFAEEVTAEDLGVENPGIFSWFKNTVDTVKIWITRDPIKKAELELKKASRQVVRIREMVEKKSEDINLEANLERVNNRYQEIVETINQRVEKFNEENPDSEKLKSFLSKYDSQQAKHQVVLEKLEEQVPEQVMEKIQEQRLEHLERYNQLMNRLEVKEQTQEETRIQERSRVEANNNEDEDNDEDKPKIRERIENVGQNVGEAIKNLFRKNK